MLQREYIISALETAAKVDKHFELFGASKHKYQLNPVISKEYVYAFEEKYSFKLPEEYFRFITEIGDGGACVDYGIESFAKSSTLKETKKDEIYRHRYEIYCQSLGKPFCPRKMRSDEVDEFGFSMEAYKKLPDNFYVSEIPDDDELWDTNGFLVLGTHGDQWDYGIVITGAFRGKIFDMDNEGGFYFVANSFEEFYQNWLDSIEKSKLINKLEEQRERMKKRK